MFVTNKTIPVFLLLLLANHSFAQHQELSEKPQTYKGKSAQTSDTTSILAAFKRGHVNGHFRYYFMSTQNEPGLTDYFAHAAGGGLRFETAGFHGFRFAVSGFYTFNIGSSDLGKPDAATGQVNRYEIALFDVEDPYNKKDLDRLEEFYLKYNYQKSFIVYGRQLINTPFINLQDGRMRPTGVEGVWLELNEIPKTKIEGGWLSAVSPRGTTHWFNTAASVGIYPAGVTASGSKSQYRNNLQSKGIFMLGVQVQTGKYIEWQVWNLLAENIFNSAMLQADIRFPLKNNSKFFAAAQFVRQDALKNGGNADAEKAYFEKGGRAAAFGAKAGWKNNRWETSINMNRITKTGRYLMPREWGREPFFTFLPRERNEGFADVTAVMAKAGYQLPKQRLNTSLAAGYYRLPDIKNYRFNKYGLPSYLQINADVRYTFSKMFSGLEAQLLVAGKIKKGDTGNNKRYEINKVNVTIYNFVLNYHF